MFCAFLRAFFVSVVHLFYFSCFFTKIASFFITTVCHIPYASDQFRAKRFFCIAEILQRNFLLYKKSAVILYSEMFQKHPRIHNMTTDWKIFRR